MNSSSGTDRPFNSKEISAILDIGDSTLRKWCLAIEEQKYYFPRTEGNKRLFFKKDVEMLKQFRKYVKVQNLSMNDASRLVVEDLDGVISEENEQENGKNSVLVGRSDSEIIQRLVEHIERQEQFIEKQETFNKELLVRLEEQRTYFREHNEQRDQYLMETLEKNFEQQKQIAVAKEEENPKENISIWKRLFGK
ncbi:hypothetical protein [Cytobacillus kochii]|uniref:hypothetical protein n=1 Tax=Cytobacillus kochii TaxID=859143 RepID=UPI00247FCF49|nr:hypothetical protein [Cytobacillus kochii]